MNTLVIDLAMKPTLAIIEDEKLISEAESKEQGAEFLMKNIDEILQKNNITIDDIGTIKLNIGPGSFTGLRVAISVAKGLGFENEMKFETFSSFDLLPKANKTIVLSAFSSFVYIKMPDGNCDCVEITSLEKDKKYITFDQALFEKLSGFDIEKTKKLSYEKIKCENKKINELEPMYLRKSQAEIARETKLKNAK